MKWQSEGFKTVLLKKKKKKYSHTAKSVRLFG